MNDLLDKTPLPESIKDAIKSHEESGTAIYVPLIEGASSAGNWVVSLPVVKAVKSFYKGIFS